MNEGLIISVGMLTAITFAWFWLINMGLVVGSWLFGAYRRPGTLKRAIRSVSFFWFILIVLSVIFSVAAIL